ncbi:MAG TPA: hypothetical protein DEP05_03330, partial [Betaproteobacteria bacterium]|nr:hypothetical protein [Betaproteobacteria bacterium]
QVSAYLRQCSRSRNLLPAPFKWRAANAEDTGLRWQGFMLRAEGMPPQVVLRCAVPSGSANAFQSLNHEIEKQQEALRELQKIRASLEMRVEERTRDLQASNADLQHTVETLKKTQNQLVHAEKMASLGGLVAGISHEINTPIGVGVTSASNLEEEIAKLRSAFEDGSMKRSTLERFIGHGTQASTILLTNLRRAAELISSFKQVAVDQSSDEWRTLDLHSYVDEILTSLQPKWKRTSIQVVNACDAGLNIHTHPGAIYQVISNLILNSLVHAFEPDQPGEIRIIAERRDDAIRLMYRDDGKGIPAEHIDRIFDPFFTTKRGAGGSGLGLHIVYNLVTGTLKGAITSGNNTPHGAAFDIVFPDYLEENKQCA